MADELQFPLVNGRRHGFASILLKFKFNGQTAQLYCKSINYTRKRNRGLVRANHPDPIAKTIGENEYTGDCELFFAEFMVLKRMLGKGYGDKPFTAQVTYGETGFETVTDELLGCTLDSIEASMSQGSDPLVRKCDLAPLKVIFDGDDDLENPLTAPPS